MSIGENLKNIRVKKGMSQSELAEAVSVSGSMINQIERGRKGMSINLCIDIAKVLDCDINDLIAERLG
ncbi:MAG: helix-turn-helix transcriptional regulator [Lachnospiraceae bacterium]|nr:helix-turn-helix transcriptional regulator [Lachnospiraceae bacterium]